MNEYLGIDYGNGKTNIDPETEIRFGVIHHGTVGSAWYDEADMDYIVPEKELEQAINDEDCETIIAWFADHGIEEIFEPDTLCQEIYEILLEKFNDHSEPLGFYIDRDGLKAYQDAESPEIIITKSPFYTYGQFCSPCFPGAINLDHTFDYVEENIGGVDCKWQSPLNFPQKIKSYCFNHDWFEDGKAPYRVFKVLDNTEVFPKEN